MRYLVAEGAIGPEGRKVRCANCGHMWVQEPETGLDEELFGPSEDDNLPPAEDVEVDFQDHETGLAEEDGDEAAEEDAFQAILQKEIDADELGIPQGVRPYEHEELIIPPKTEKRVKVKADRLGGFATAAVIWLFIFGVLVLNQETISRAWPPSNMIYTLIGMKPSVPGEGLALDNLQAKLENGHIVMTGDINNLRETDAAVPSIMAMIVDDKDKVLDQVLIAPPSKTVQKESKVSFDVTYPSLPKNASNVNFAFSFVKAPTPKAKAPAKEAVKEEPMTPASPAPAETPHS